MSLAEIMLAMAILSSITLAIVIAMARGMDLNRIDAAVTETTMLCNEVMEQNTRLAANAYLFDYLPDKSYTFFTGQQTYIYAQSVTDYSATLKRLTVAIYYQDTTRSVPAPDTHRPRSGQAIRMTTLLERPSSKLGGP